jgi:hypothetical protein
VLLTAGRGSAISLFLVFFLLCVLFPLWCRLVIRVFDPPTGIRPSDADDYSAEFGGVATTVERPRTPTMAERAPGIAIATVLVALSLGVCIIYFHQLGGFGILLVIAALALGADGARVLGAHRMARAEGRTKKSAGPIQS